MTIDRRREKPLAISVPCLLAAALLFAFCLSPASSRAQTLPPQERETTPAAVSQQDAAALTSSLEAIRDSQARILAELEKLDTRVGALEEKGARTQARVAPSENQAQGDLGRAQALYMENLTQGGNFWQNTGFKFNNDGTATLTGVGTASLNSHESSVNGGSGAQMYMIFTDLQDPLFKKCLPLLQKQFTSSFPVTTSLSVFGLGTYEMGAADPRDPNNITRAFAFRIGKLTECDISR